MIYEYKKISPAEFLLFFSEQLPLIGTFYAAANTKTEPLPDSPEVIANIFASELASEILLTNSFVYLRAAKPETAADLQALSAAEIDDWQATGISPQKALPGQYTENKIKIILKSVIAPFMQQDGGDIELAGISGSTVRVRFLGKCHGCPYAQRTLKENVEKTLVRFLPEIKEVIML